MSATDPLTPAGPLTRADLEVAIGPVAADVDQLAEAVGILLDAHEQQTGTAAARTNRWCWRTATEADAAQLWSQLTEWVDWFNTRYGTASSKVSIPACWPLHPVAVEELTALMLAWQAAHAATAPSDGPLTWHDRAMWPCLDRLHERPGTFKDCTSTRHDLRHTVPVTTTDPAALTEAMNPAPKDPA